MYLIEQSIPLNKIFKDYFNNEKHSPRKLRDKDYAAFAEIDFSTLDSAPSYIQLNVPEWLSVKLQDSLGDRFEQEMQASNQRAKTDIRINTLKSTLKQVTHFLKQSGYQVEPSDITPWGLRFKERVSLFNHDTFKQGWFEIQDQGSQLLAQLTDVKAGDRVVDFCAGAGGKTLAMAAMMKNKGSIWACDVHSKRLQQTIKRAKRAGVYNCRTQHLKSENDKWVKHHSSKSDVVLIDAPCSGTGTWRRNPDSRWHLTEKALGELIDLQQSILTSSSRLVKPGGKLLYATCSLLKQENEDQIEWFLNGNSQFELSQLNIQEPLKNNLDCVLYNNHELRTLPYLSDTDGFYVCALRRKE